MSFEEFEPAGLPSPEVLRPAKREDILERCVGQQIAYFKGLSDPGPYGEAMCALVLVGTERPIFRATPVPADAGGNVFCTAILPWWLDRLKIITARMYREYRTAHLDQPEIYRRIQGELVLGFHFLEAPNRFGGETLQLDLTNGAGGQDLFVHGAPATANYTGNYVVELKPNKLRRVVFL